MSPVSARFGRIVGPTDVSLPLAQMLRDYFPAYLAEAERQAGLVARTIPQPKHYGIGLDVDDHRVQHGLPAVLVAAPDMGDVQRGTRVLDGAFAVQVSTFVKGDRSEDVMTLSGRYTGAVRLCVLRELHRALDGAGLTVGEFSLTGESYDEAAPSKRTVLGIASSVFTVGIEEIVDLGPTPFPDGPPADPYAVPANYPLVEAAYVDVRRQENQ
jgi:hypothetical protein